MTSKGDYPSSEEPRYGTFKFLPENPIISENLKFGHGEIANTLERIVTVCHAPFTIGLYGKWGSGKSTITENLKVALKKRCVPLVIFDVWKHEGDALRRTFLKELDSQLKSDFGHTFYNIQYELSSRIDGSEKHQEIKSSTNVNWKWSKLKEYLRKPLKYTGFSIVGICAMCTIAWIVALYNLPYLADWLSEFYIDTLSLIWEWIKVIVPFVLGASLFGKLIEKAIAITGEITTESVETVHRDRFQDPHEFEDEFCKILDNLQNERIVIAFDNLDRVSGESAVRIISTIKTFLEPADRADQNKEVVFLIPCDVQAVKEHLVHEYTNDHENDLGKASRYADEFLRKFFNTIVRITDFHDIEMKEYAKLMLKRTEVDAFSDSDQLPWLITKVFRNNPRQVIQFINILLASYLMVQERITKGDLQPEIIGTDQKLAEFAKYILLSQYYSDIVQHLKETKQLQLIGKSEDMSFDLPDNLGSQPSEFRKFLRETDHIPVTNLRIWFTLKLSDDELELPGIDSLMEALEDRDMEVAKEIAEQIELKKRIPIFCNVSSSYLERTESSLLLCTVIGSLFQLSSALNISYDRILYKEIENKLSGTGLSNIHVIGPQDLNDELYSKYPRASYSKKRMILNQCVASIGANLYSSDDETRDAVMFASEHINSLSAESVKSLQKTLGERYNTSDWAIELLTTDEELQNVLMTDKFVEGIINTITMENI